MPHVRVRFVALACLFIFGSSAFAQSHPAVPAFSSRPGAAYTLYLDFAGFTFTGNWGGVAADVPGTTPAYTLDGDATSFTATELANIKNAWSRTAEKFIGFNINVTTVDPAVAAGQAATDFQRQAYYDATARVMHTVIGGNGSWKPGAGGWSYLSTAQNSYPTSGNGGAGLGWHTNWGFSALAPSHLPFLGEISAHENGHALRLSHQSDYSGTTLLVEYSAGTGGSGAGTVAPIMGNSYETQRGTWRTGSAHSNSTGLKIQQNDVLELLGNNGIGPLMDDGIGHVLASATPLPKLGNVIDSAAAKGFIVPASSTAPNPIGVNNYTTDFFSFSTSGGNVTINLLAGRSTITPGFADPGATLDGSLAILDASGNVLFNAATANLNETLNVNLPGGNYFIRVNSAGGRTITSPGAEPAQYFDMGSYFLTGFIAVPEPTTIALLSLAGFAAVAGVYRVRRRRRAMLDMECDQPAEPLA
jgi:hypothetical protein